MIKTTKKELMKAAELIKSVCISKGNGCYGCPFDTATFCMFYGNNPSHWDNNIKTEEVMLSEAN